MPHPDVDLRLIAVRKPEEVLAQVFRGVIVDPAGSIKVGETVVHPKEVPWAVGLTASEINDLAGESASGPALETLLESLWNDENLRPLMVAVFEHTVKTYRQSPNLLATSV